MSALIKDSITRRIIIESGAQFAYPEVLLEELKRHKNYILKKTGYSEEAYEKILSTLLDYINLIPIEFILPKLSIAKKIMQNIDMKSRRLWRL